MSLILDSSATLAWAFDDESVPLVDDVFSRIGTDGAWVPAVWPLEVANALMMGERRQRITPAQTGRLLSALGALPITVDPADRGRVWGSVVAIARAERLTTYDAAYLDLAIRLGLPLATLDARMRAAAERIGVPLVAVDA